MSLLVCLEKNSLQKSFEKTQSQRNQKRAESNQLEKINFKINLKWKEKRTKIQSGLYLLIYEINADFYTQCFRRFLAFSIFVHLKK